MKKGIDAIDALESDYLFTRISGISNSGLGLFTVIDIYKDEIIAVFKGENLAKSEAELRIKNGTDQYFINMPDGTILDSMNVNCFAKYANDAKGSSLSQFKNNAMISLSDDNAVCIIAKRNIIAGEEIFCSYGKKYWKKHGI